MRAVHAAIKTDPIEKWQDASLMLTEAVGPPDLPVPSMNGSSANPLDPVPDREEGIPMMTPAVVRDHVKAEPFRPFRINMVTGKTFDIRHPEIIKILKSHVLVFSSSGESDEFPEEFQSVSLMLAESISYLEAAISQ